MNFFFEHNQIKSEIKREFHVIRIMSFEQGRVCRVKSSGSVTGVAEMNGDFGFGSIVATVLYCLSQTIHPRNRANLFSSTLPKFLFWECNKTKLLLVFI